MPYETLTRCKSNAAVESHFKAVKNNRLAGKLRVRPREFLLLELQYVMGKLKAWQLPAEGVKASRKKLADVQNASEKWRKRRRSVRYADPTVVKKLRWKFEADKSVKHDEKRPEKN
jgi:hypothetical protein